MSDFELISAKEVLLNEYQINNSITTSKIKEILPMMPVNFCIVILENNDCKNIIYDCEV